MFWFRNKKLNFRYALFTKVLKHSVKCFPENLKQTGKQLKKPVLKPSL